MKEPLVLYDGVFYSRKQYPEIYSVLLKHPKLGSVTEAGFKTKFVGALIYGDNILISAPKLLNLPEDPGETESLIIRVLLRYRQTHFFETEKIPTLFGSSEFEGNQISLMIEILEDYFRNGIIRRWQQQIRINKPGNPDWNRSVKKMNPLITGKSVIYPEIYTRSKRDNLTDPVRLTHEYIVGESIDRIGWLLGMENSLQYRTDLKIPEDELIRKLRTELRQTYSERDIRLIQLMLSWLESEIKIKKDKTTEILAVPHFHVIWEAACGSVTENIYPQLSDLLPQPRYTGKLEKAKVSQRPDIFTVDNSVFYIFDAKYYNYKQGAPGWEDLVKQYFYLYSLQSVAHTSKFRDRVPDIKFFKNALLLPGDLKEVEYLGCAKVDGIGSLPDIDVLAVNASDTLKAYAYNDIRLARNIRQNIVHTINKMHQ